MSFVTQRQGLKRKLTNLFCDNSQSFDDSDDDDELSESHSQFKMKRAARNFWPSFDDQDDGELSPSPHTSSGRSQTLNEPTTSFSDDFIPSGFLLMSISDVLIY